jgi:acetyl esterase/lipase
MEAYRAEKRSTRRARVARTLCLVLVGASLLGMRSTDQVTIRRDLVYKSTDSGSLTLDTYRLRGRRGMSVLILIHGGSWRRGDKSDWDGQARRFARAGFLVVAPNYRLAPPGGNTIFPGHLTDLRRSLEWARRNARDYRGDPRRVGMIGASAGAHLTLLKAASDRDRPEAVALYSPPVDLRRLYRQDVIADSIRAFLACPPADCPETYRRASGLERLDRGTSPVFLAYSRNEILPAAQGRALDRRLDRVGVTHKVRELPGAAHGLKVGEKVMDQTIRFMQRRLAAR